MFIVRYESWSLRELLSDYTAIGLIETVDKPWSLQDLSAIDAAANSDWYDSYPWINERQPEGYYLMSVQHSSPNQEMTPCREKLLSTGEKVASIALIYTTLLGLIQAGQELRGKFGPVDHVSCSERSANSFITIDLRPKSCNWSRLTIQHNTQQPAYWLSARWLAPL